MFLRMVGEYGPGKKVYRFRSEEYNFLKNQQPIV